MVMVLLQSCNNCSNVVGNCCHTAVGHGGAREKHELEILKGCSPGDHGSHAVGGVLGIIGNVCDNFYQSDNMKDVHRVFQ
jgi:hypothetical protein